MRCFFLILFIPMLNGVFAKIICLRLRLKLRLRLRLRLGTGVYEVRKQLLVRWVRVKSGLGRSHCFQEGF